MQLGYEPSLIEPATDEGPAGDRRPAPDRPRTSRPWSPPPSTAGTDLSGAYLHDRREWAFFLWELFRVDQKFLGRAPSEHISRSHIEDLYERAWLHAGKLAAANREGDRNPAHLNSAGEVEIPQAYRELWEEHKRDWFWLRQQTDGSRHSEATGRQIPHIVIQSITEMFIGANPSFMTYAGFTPSAVTVIRTRASDKQQALFLPHLQSVEWDACFCATESQAGSDLTALSTQAAHIEDDIYAVSGEKCYITAGMHPLTSNTVYIVLGRLKEKAESPLSLSCFLVPRFWIGADGALQPNGVECVGVEDKMGLNGCANTRLRFGAGAQTRGFLLGDKPNVALLQLLGLMRKARIGTGQIALGMASSAYLHALNYARLRVQGAPFDQSSNPNARPVPIIEHRDVQRMLLGMKAQVEGCRILMGRITECGAGLHQIAAGEGADERRKQKLERLSLLLTPVAKAYISDQAWDVISTAIQVHGAPGYFRDRPLEQYARDARILSIWEGTNYIQAQDLVRDKLRFSPDSPAFRDFKAEVESVMEHASNLGMDAEISSLSDALARLEQALRTVRARAKLGEMLLISQFATRLLDLFGAIAVGWGLLEAAAVAASALRRTHDPDDAAFYRGKIKVARYFMHNVLPVSVAQLGALEAADRAYVDVQAEEFGYTTPARRLDELRA